MKLRLRVVVPVVVLVAGAGWALAATRGLERGVAYYYSPSELAGRRPSTAVIRVGGRVVPGSVRWDATRAVLHFRLTDGRASVAVANAGAPPQLFRAGAGAIVEGTLVDGTLRSDQVIVKHDQNYRPPGPRKRAPAV